MLDNGGSTKNDKVEIALKYIDLGWSIIPIAEKSKYPLKGHSWKKYQTQKPTKEEVINWWTNNPTANIALVTGPVSNIIAIDIDSYEGQEHLKSLCGYLPGTISQNTGREGGLHLLFQYPAGQYNNLPKLLDNNDDIHIKGMGGFIVISPSVHSTGRKYTWNIDPIETKLYDLLPFPSDLLPYLKSNIPLPPPIKKANPPGWENDLLFGVAEGKRNIALAKLAGKYLNDHNGDTEKVIEILQKWNENNKPPLDWKQIKRTVEVIEKKRGNSLISSVLSSQTRKDIEKIVIKIYADGSKKFDVYLNGIDGYMSLSASALGKFQEFKYKFLDFANYIPPAMKQKQWEALLNIALKDAEVKIMSEDETIIAPIKQIINTEIDEKRRSEDITLLPNRIIVFEGKIYVTISTICHRLLADREKISKKEVGKILRDWNFDSLRNSKLRYWSISLEKWEKIIS